MAAPIPRECVSNKHVKYSATNAGLAVCTTRPASPQLLGSAKMVNDPPSSVYWFSSL